VALAVVAFRVVLQIAFGAPVGADVLWRTPSLQLPDWFTGLRIGGVVTEQSLRTSLTEALRIASTVMVIAAAAAATSTTKLLRNLPASLHSFGMLVIIAVTFIPNIFRDVARMQSAHRWRGNERNRFKVFATNIVNVCSSALDRSIALAGSMTTRGFSHQAKDNALLTLSYVSMAMGLGVWLAAPQHATLSMAASAVGVCALLVHSWDAERISVRTRYRKDRWQLSETAVVVSAIAAVFVWPASLSIALVLAALPLVVTPTLAAPRDLVSS
jgi:energy-coupling factor transport system permease protein